MNNKILMLSIVLLTCTFSYGQSQDSARTRNDKPGTPSSLRTPDNSPQNTIHTINGNRPSNQSINHGSTENTDVNAQKKVMDGNNANTIQIPAASNNSSLYTDSTLNKNHLYNKPSNVTDPTRK